MLQGLTARATAPRRMARHGTHFLTGCAATVLLFGAAPATAQQYGSTQSSVTVDYGVLDSLGADPNLPALLGGGMPQQGTPVYGYPGSYATGGQLLAPPSAAPRSTLTLQDPAADQRTAAIKLIPPSEFKNRKNAATSLPPAPQPAPPPPVQQAANEPTPPPAPTPVQPETATAPPASESAVEPQTAEMAAPPAPPAPEPQTAEAAAPPAPAAPEPQAAPGSELSAGGALTGSTGTSQASPDSGGDPETEAEPAEAVADAAPPDPSDSMAATDAAAEEDAPVAEAGDAPGETQLAALPPSPDAQISVSFSEDSSELSSGAQAALEELAAEMRSDPAMRIQLLAYAQAVDDNASRARRTSLSRALEVRSFLIERGVQSTRMDVRALGSNVEGEPADRVDIITQAQ